MYYELLIKYRVIDQMLLAIARYCATATTSLATSHEHTQTLDGQVVFDIHGNNIPKNVCTQLWMLAASLGKSEACCHTIVKHRAPVYYMVQCAINTFMHYQ